MTKKQGRHSSKCLLWQLSFWPRIQPKNLVMYSFCFFLRKANHFSPGSSARRITCVCVCVWAFWKEEKKKRCLIHHKWGINYHSWQSISQWHFFILLQYLIAGFVFKCAQFLSKMDMFTVSQAHFHALTNATRRHEYLRGLSRLWPVPGVLVSFLDLRFLEKMALFALGRRPQPLKKPS